MNSTFPKIVIPATIEKTAAVVLIAAVFSIVAGITIFGKVLFKFNPKYGIIVAVVFILLIKALSPKGGE